MDTARWYHDQCTTTVNKQYVRIHAARSQSPFAKPQEGQALSDSPFGDTLADAPPPRMAFSIAFTTPFAQ